MKKITTIIAITLLAALLFTGCSIIPMKKDFSQYGFTLSIAGEVTVEKGSKEGSAALITQYGTISFSKMLIDFGLSEGSIAKECETKETTEIGTIYYFAPAEDRDGNVQVATYYFAEDAEGNTWMVSCFTPEDAYNKLVITNIYKSIVFVNAE